MKTINRSLTALLLLLSLSSIPLALAQDVKPPTIPCAPNVPCITEETQKKGGESVRDFVINTFAGNFITGFISIIGITAVIFIIVGGLQLHLALGNEEALKKAKTTIMWSITGLVIALLSVAIVRIVTQLPFK